jgi:hypothetical protein
MAAESGGMRCAVPPYACLTRRSAVPGRRCFFVCTVQRRASSEQRTIRVSAGNVR